MAEYTWPDGRLFTPATATLRVVDNTQRAAESALTGDVQTTSLPGARWAWDFDFATDDLRQRAQVEAYLVRLSGRQHRVRLWDIKRPAPAGTINHTGVATSASAAQFAEQLQLSGCGAGATLLAGDWFSVAGQLLMCVADAAANGSGVMTVQHRHMLRQAVASGAPVTLHRPSALFIRTESGLALPRAAGKRQPGFSTQFVEVFA